MASAHHWIWLAVLAVSAGALGTARATETDQYYAIDKPPRDSLGVLNEKVNRDILGALDVVNRGAWERDSCEDVARHIYQRFRISGLHKIELWAENSPRIDRVPTREDHRRFTQQDSIYRNDRLWDWGLAFGIKATFTVAGVHLGADKLSHFFQTGWKYDKRYREAIQAGVPEHEALERIIRYGAETEGGTLGMVTTGVFSFADLEANYQGFLFYRSLCEDPNPRIQKTSGGWRLTRPFDWREYVSSRLDETCNNSAFTPKRWSEVQSNLRRDYCARLDSDVFQEHFRSCSRSARGPDDFSIRYLQELISRGELPRQEDSSIWAACGRTRPDFGSGGPEAPSVASSPPPQYETPRLEEPLLRPMFEMGSGGFSTRSDWNVLLRTRFVLRDTVVPEDAWDSVRTPEYLLWASLDGTLAANPAGVTQADLRITPVERRFELNDAASGRTLAVGIAFAPARLTRFTPLDRKLGVELSVIGIRGRLGTSLGERQRMSLFASVAVDAPGYKAALHQSGPDSFQGVHAIAVTAEAGAALLLGGQFRLGLVLGGRAGLALGWNGGAGFSAPSDLQAYAEAQAEVTRSLRLFVRGQLDALREPALDRTLSAPALLAGASVRF